MCRVVAYQFVFQPLALDVELHSSGAGTGAGAGTRTGATGAEVAAASSTASAMGAVAVLRSADLIDGDTAKASAAQGKPPTAGVIPSHDHCSHTRITVTVEEEEGAEEMLSVNIISSNQHLNYSVRHFFEDPLPSYHPGPLYHLDSKNKNTETHS